MNGEEENENGKGKNHFFRTPFSAHNGLIKMYRLQSLMHDTKIYFYR